MERVTKNDSGQVVLINIMEELVRQMVDRCIKDFEMCTCEKCRLNICAIALNHLPPHYVTTQMGGLLGKLEHSGINQTTLYIEIVRASKIVKEKPSH